MLFIISYLIVLIIIPVIISFLGTQIWNFVLENKKKKKERTEKLYNPLRFYLILMKETKKTQEILIEDNKKRNTELNVFDGAKERIDKFSKDILRPLNSDWFFYAEKFKSLLELNAGLINKEHWQVFADFIRELRIRELVFIEKDQYKDTTSFLTFKMVDQGANELWRVVEKMEKILL